jgi:MFS family permease
VAPVIAAVVERVPRKVVMVSADLIRAGIAVMLPFVTATWQIYVLIFVLQAASATFTPTFQSVIPAVLPDTSDYTKGLSLSRLAYDMESVLSPVLAAALLTVISYHSLFVGTVVGFLCSAILVVGTALPRLSAAPRSGQRLPRRIVQGAVVMWRVPQLRALLAFNLVVGAATALVLVNTVVYVRDLLGGSQTAVAIALGCYGAGSMIVAIILPRWLDRHPSERPVMLTGAALGVAGLIAAMVWLIVTPTGIPGWATLIPIWLLLGAATSLINTPSARLLRTYSDEDNRSVVFTAQFSLSHGCFMITYPVAGILGATLGQPQAVALLVVAGAAATIAAARVWRPHTAAPDTERTTAANTVATT